jgi:TP901 family phage tail tape measure protein
MANSTQEAIRIAAEGIAKLKVEMTSLNAVILDGATKLNSMLSADTTSFKELSELLKQVEKSTVKLNEASTKKNKTLTEMEKVVKSLKDAQDRLAVTNSKEYSDLIKTRKAITDKNASLRGTKKAIDDILSPYDKLISKQKSAKKVLLDLMVAQGKNTTETRKAQKEYDRLTQKVNQANLATKNFSVKGLNSMAAGFRNLLSAFGIIGGIQIFARAIGDTFNRVREFDKSMQNLAGVFRTNRTALKPLEETIISVAGASIKTSREVANLAETLATLGKSPEQIQKLLKPVVELGIGLNATGAEAGEFLIQMLNAFGASDDEAVKYADTIATIRTSTTLDFQKMRDSFQYIAPISRLLGKDLAYTGAVVGILADNGLKAQQAGRVLGTSLQKLAIKGLTLTQALEQINQAQREGVKETELLAMANSLLGAEGAKIGIVLARNSEIIDINAEAIRNNGGALDDLVNQQLESLDAKLLLLDASWEKLVISIDNGTGAISTFFKAGIDGLTNFVNAASDFNLISEIVGDTDSESLIDKIFPLGSVFSSATRFGKLGAEFKAMTESFESVDLANIGDVKQATIDFEKAKIQAKDNLDVVKLIEYYLVKLKRASTDYYESGRTAQEEKMKNELKARLGIEKDENMLKALQSRLKDLTYEQKQLGTGLTIKSSQYDSWTKLNEEIAKTKTQIEELTGKKDKKEKKIKRPKVEGLDLPEIIGTDDVERLTKYQKELIRVLEISKELEDVPELMPLSDETLDRLREYNRVLQETKNKADQLEALKGIFSEVTDTFSDMFDIDMSKFDFIFDSLADKSKDLFSTESIGEWADLSKELIGSVLDASLQRYEVELQAAQVARDLTLDNDLATEEQKEAARNQFREKERDINTRKAKEERKNNLIKIAVDTSVGVVKTFAEMGFVAGLPFAALMLGVGIAQAAIVASQPLPKFEKGTQNAPQGMATTDEKGAEIHTDKLGNIKDLGSNQGARNKYLEKGDKIFTADQSKNMLEGFDANHLQRVIFDMNMISNGNILSEKAVDRSLLNKMDALASSNEMVWKEVKKLASRPISVNNKVEIKQDRAY